MRAALYERDTLRTYEAAWRAHDAHLRALVVIVWIGVLAGCSVVRLDAYQSEQALWASAQQASPQKPRPTLNLGRVHELAGDLATAEAAYRRTAALAMLPGRTPYEQRFIVAAVETNLAHLDMKRGNLASAMRRLDAILVQWPDFPYAQYNRGAILWAVGACDLALAAFTVAQRGDAALAMPSQPCGAP